MPMDTPLTFQTPATDQVTTDAYALVALDLIGSRGTYLPSTVEYVDTKYGGPLSYTIENTDGANSLTHKLMGYNDPASHGTIAEMVEVEAEAALAAAGVAGVTQAVSFWRFHAIAIKATVGGSQGDAKVRGHHLRLSR